MPLSSDLKAHYEAVLQDFEAERQQVLLQIAPLQNKLKEIHTSIAALSKRINPETSYTPTSTLRKQSHKYVNMSVRWAILDILNEAGAMTTSDIADALTNAGIQTRAANFVNNVSAVLSTTLKGKGEVAPLPNGQWELTENGKKAIGHIRTTEKFERAIR